MGSRPVLSHGYYGHHEPNLSQSDNGGFYLKRRRSRGVKVNFELADVHTWQYPEAAFDVVVEIFTQFSTPGERKLKWAGMRRALKPGGLLIIQGYTPKQLEYGTGGPKHVENLYTRAMLQDAFSDYRDLSITDEEREMHEGTSHRGMSAVINLTARKLT